MAINFVVEDGTGLNTATSYLSIEDLKQYFEDMGYSIGTTTDEEIQTYLNRSSRVLDSVYLVDFNSNGYRRDADQALEWPRYGATYIDGNLVDSDSVPKEVKNGTSEYVYGIISGLSIQGTETSDGTLKSEAVKVDVIETKNEYFEGSSMARDYLTAVDDALARLTGGVSSLNQYTIERV